MFAAIILALVQVAGAPNASEVRLAQVMADTADARHELGRTLCNDATRTSQADDADRRFERMQQAFERRFRHRWTRIGMDEERGACDLPSAFGRTLADYENAINRLEAAFAIT